VPSSNPWPPGLLNGTLMSIFLDIFNVFLLVLDLFGGERD
jgi:hypothetical protein